MINVPLILDATKLRSELNGRRISDGDPFSPTTRTYLIDCGYKRLIPNRKTYYNLFESLFDVEEDENLVNQIATGTAITDGAYLAMRESSFTTKEVYYFIDNKTKRLIHYNSPTYDNHYHFVLFNGRVRRVDKVVLRQIPTGDPIG